MVKRSFGQCMAGKAVDGEQLLLARFDYRRNNPLERVNRQIGRRTGQRYRCCVWPADAFGPLASVR